MLHSAHYGEVGWVHTWNYNFFFTKDYYLSLLVTWNHVIVNKLLILDKNTWNYISTCKLFLLRILTLRHSCLQIIIISYLKPYNFLQNKTDFLRKNFFYLFRWPQYYLSCKNLQINNRMEGPIFFQELSNPSSSQLFLSVNSELL